MQASSTTFIWIALLWSTSASCSAANSSNTNHVVEDGGLPNCTNVILRTDILNQFLDCDYFFFETAGNQTTAPGSNWTDTVRLCFPLSPQLLSCDLVAIQPSAYDISNDSRTLTRNDHNFTAKLGDYYVYPNGTAGTCSEPINEKYKGPRCNYLDLKPEEYEIIPNGSLRIKLANVMIERPIFAKNDGADGIVRVCYPLSIKFLNCAIHVLLTPLQYVLLPGGLLHANNLQDTFDLSEYYVKNGDRDVVVPYYNYKQGAITVAQSRLISKIYSVFYLMSILCLMMTSVYLFQQNSWSCHARCMLCYLLSMALMYVMVVIKKFIVYQAIWECYVVFFFHYFSMVASLFWLNVLTVDMCHSFATLKNSPNKVYASSKGRSFLYYSIYAWGVAALCGGFAIALDLSKNAQKFLHLYTGISSACWFNSLEADWAFYHGPLIIVAVANAICYILTIRYIHLAGDGTDLVNRHRKQQLLIVSIKLFIIMGMWLILEGILWAMKDYIKFPEWYVSDVITSLIGVAVFVIYTLKHATYQQIVDYLVTNCCSFSQNNTIFEHRSESMKSHSKDDNDDVSRKLSNDTIVTQLSLSLQ